MKLILCFLSVLLFQTFAADLTLPGDRREPGEAANLFSLEPGKAEELFTALKADIARGRSR